METTQTVFICLSCIMMAVALSACCGFKVFVPPLVLSIFIRAGLVSVGENFAWLGSWLAIAVLGGATITEIVAYYVPVVNHALDVAKIPIAAIAGAITASAAMSGEISPIVRWVTAVIVGGTSAAAVSTAMAGTRAIAGALSGDTIGTWLVNTGEWLLAICTSFLTAIAPILIGLLCIILVIIGSVLAWKIYRRFKARKTESANVQLAANA